MYFVTGTDTDSGKTLVSSALLSLAKGSKFGLKPIASGCEVTSEGLRNADALALMEQANVELDYHIVNPIAFEPAIAPHIAAANQGLALTEQRVTEVINQAPIKDVDFALIEGAGGWLLPLGGDQLMSRAIKQLEQNLSQDGNKLGVILVVGMKLGCLNHALLTQQAIEADGLEIAGWVANQVDAEMSEIDANLASLKTLMTSPFLGYIPHLNNAKTEHASQFIDIEKLTL
ncbi:dethiobiotin synthase [Shewanella sp. WXL01]|uniref:dethiobiotin synthase n=1 Tax=Shewanella sp. WXL01 TaxID=2709721 RepID=UPI0014383E6D|nr:dethiobiotin synthase [Shewanella sp. WXL01]